MTVNTPNIHRDGKDLPEKEVAVLSKRQIPGALLLFLLLLVCPGNISRFRLEWDLFGLAPVKEVHLGASPEIRLVPGGQSIGILLQTNGAMVVGFSPVITSGGNAAFPARDAGVHVGDMIFAINGRPVCSDDEVREIITDSSQNRQEMEISLKRKDETYLAQIQPQYCVETDSMRIGLFIRDNAGGIGTLTFYDPQSSVYGALGHVISDSYINAPLDIRQGKILPARVEDVKKGSRGAPGEKVGVFAGKKDYGNVTQNEACGIYGTLTDSPRNPLYDSLPIAYAHQIQVGKASILTVISQQEIQEFEIMIDRILPGKDDGKNMIMRIVDPVLLSVAGGIVQGMSGSPIIQNNRIVGAVTHVFVSDPTRGYGVFIENMLMESGVLPSKTALGIYSQGLFTWGLPGVRHGKKRVKNEKILENSTYLCRIVSNIVVISGKILYVYGRIP
jgi:stage IV sporulation protein B